MGPHEPVRVVLAGARGHGLWHLANLRRLTKAGLVDLVGVCDVDRVDLTEFVGLGDPVQSDDLGALIERTAAEITILVTPIHTHAALAVTAMLAGSHLLLEKPPAGSLADFEWISTVARDTGSACQVGFQALGSEAIPFLRKVIAGGQLGRVTGVGVAGAWDRPASYFTRALWSGRRRLGGVAVTDGALTNPFAHAVAAALAVVEAEQLGAVAEIDVELYRANAIEADDTSCVRLRLPDGTALTIAVTLCAPGRNEPYLVVHGETGQATLDYTLDQVTLRPAGSAPTTAPITTTHARTDLLENLVAHIRTGAQLLVPLSRTGSFMQVVEAVRLAPEPLPIPADHQEVHRSAGVVARRVVPGIVDATARSADRLALYSELDLPWAPQEQVVHLAGRDVARYRWRVDPQAGVSPRPHLHSVCTFGGVEVSETAPADHSHHHGHHHGTQRHLRFGRRTTDGFVEHLEWLAPDGVPVLGEQRAVTAHALDGSCWVLDFSFTLTNLAADPRAGYGGFFWRAPGSATNRTVFTAVADGEESVNGSRAPWVAMSGTAPDGRDWTLVFAQRGSDDPWFVRVREYPGIGPAIAGERPLVLDGSLTRRVVTVVADGRLDRDTVASLVSVRVPRAPRGR